jgi:hypothetical protein
MLFDLAARLDAPIDVVSRSDSTLRGHVIAEVRALDAVRRHSSSVADGRVWRHRPSSHHAASASGPPAVVSWMCRHSTSHIPKGELVAEAG